MHPYFEPRFPNFVILLALSLFLVGNYTHFVFAEDIRLVQNYDIAEIMMNKYKVSVEQDEFTVFYRLSVVESAGGSTLEDLEAKVTSINVNQERVSLVITLDNIEQTDIMSLRLPKELISAEGKQLALFIDGKEIQYEWSVKGEYNNLIFIIPKQTTEIEVVGTRVIPEFPSGLLIFGAVSSGLVVGILTKRFRFDANS
jgi:hypothetical protein